MHVLESFSTSTGLKLSKPFIYEKYFPLGCDKYITLDNTRENNPPNFQNWQEIFNFLNGPLSKEQISIVQLGDDAAPEINGAIRLNGKINLGQAAYVLNNSLLHLSTDSVSCHIANAFDVQTICLINEPVNSSHAPYWKDNAKSETLFESTQDSGIIKPEFITKKVLGKLSIDFESKFETVHIGKKFADGQEFVETLPDQSVNISSMNISSIMFRMDLIFDEKRLQEQLEIGKVNIITNKPIDLDILKNYKKNIPQLVYVVEESDSPKFAEAVKNLGINLFLFSRMAPKELNKKKINYLDIDLIFTESYKEEKKKDILSHGIDKLFYKSNKFTLSEGKTFPSESAWRNGQQIGGKGEVVEFKNDPLIWRSIDNLYILKMLDS